MQRGGVPAAHGASPNTAHTKHLWPKASPATVADLSGPTALALPRASMIDGTGRCWSPWSPDLEALRLCTLVDQVIQPMTYAPAPPSPSKFAPGAHAAGSRRHTAWGITGQVLLAEVWMGLQKPRRLPRQQQAGPDGMVVSIGLGRV
ncbi:MAG: hypothetical protein R3E96_02760 [Planctomycetota bacterium]